MNNIKEQLYDFTCKWWDYTPRETDLCSFTVKVILAVLKFGGLVALVLQPVTWGGIAFAVPEVIQTSGDFLSFYYFACAFILCCYGGLAIMFTVAVLIYWLTLLVQYLKVKVDRIKCGKTITFK